MSSLPPSQICGVHKHRAGHCRGCDAVSSCCLIGWEGQITCSLAGFSCLLPSWERSVCTLHFIEADLSLFLAFFFFPMSTHLGKPLAVKPQTNKPSSTTWVARRGRGQPGACRAPCSPCRAAGGWGCTGLLAALGEYPHPGLNPQDPVTNHHGSRNSLRSRRLHARRFLPVPPGLGAVRALLAALL